MIRIILVYGLIAGLIVGAPMLGQMLLLPHDKAFPGGAVVGYLTMIVALSAVFIGVKQHRDKALGGVIKFFPALLVGLGISVVAGVIYVATWDLSLALTKSDFMTIYAQHAIAAQKAKGLAGAQLEAFSTQMNQMVESYKNPLYRWAITFVEIFPVGVVISLISAALLCNSRFMPARKA
jgi:Protein of unknown function (DUF4199)